MSGPGSVPPSRGEFELIAEVRKRLSQGAERILVPSGDDAAVVRADGVSATSIDAFVEGVHFRLATTSMRDLGHKCVAATLSDLAAMGARAGEVYMALGLPDHVDEHEVLDLVEGADALANGLGAAICGGDITRSQELFVAVTAVGYARSRDELVTRAGARPGDLLGVTGALGGAGAGLLLLERKPSGLDVAESEALIERQLRPQPRLDAGAAFARAEVRAMIDVSDGIASDCRRLAEASGVLVQVRLDALPLDEGVETVAGACDIEPVELAAAAGEDYELLISAPPAAAEAAEQAAREAGLPLSWIGEIAEGSGVRLLDAGGRPRDLHGWDHLRPASFHAHRGRAS